MCVKFIKRLKLITKSIVLVTINTFKIHDGSDKIAVTIGLLLGILFYLPIMILNKLTQGKPITDDEFKPRMEKLLNKMLPYIKRYLELDNIPKFYTINELATISGGFTFMNKQDKNYKAILDFISVPVTTEFSKLDLNENGIDSNENYYFRIILFPQSIYKLESANNVFLFEITFINNILHELTHYKQLLQNKMISKENYISNDANFVAYARQDIEVEARKSASLFVLKNLFRILFLNK